MMKKLLLLLLMIVSVAAANAQRKYFYFTIDMQKPLANTSWIDDFSGHGGRLGYRVFITDNLSAGLDLGWMSFDEYKPTETIEVTNGAITTDYFNYIYSYSAAASAQYNFKVNDAKLFFPYVGLGLGVNRQEYAQYYNIYSDGDKSWGFLARPEAGILVRFGKRKSLGAMAAAHYDFSTNKTALYGYDNFSAVGFQFGIMLMSMY
jgi:hypothetical protein